jgi:hypothetical protein
MDGPVVFSVADERLRYTMKELYHLQHEPASSLSISEMGIESMLEIFARDPCEL